MTVRITSLGLVLVMASGLAVYAMYEQSIADTARDQALSQQARAVAVVAGQADSSQADTPARQQDRANSRSPARQATRAKAGGAWGPPKD